MRALCRAAPEFRPWIDSIGALRVGRCTSHFRSLLRAVIAQQVSNKAAKTICERALALFSNPGRPSPTELLALDDAPLRGAGVSPQKLGYLRDLARAFDDGTIVPRRLARLDDEAVIDTLVTVKGIGRWTAEMFLIFSLRRPDVFAAGDLALRNGIMRLMGRSDLTPTKCDRIALAWRPWRSVASLYLWRIAHAPEGRAVGLESPW